MWISFLDMHSGGSTKTDYEEIFIEANDEDRAVEIFETEFNEDPYDVACGCCGSNFSVNVYETLDEATKYYRRDNCLEDYLKREDVRVMFKEEIK